MMMVTTRRESMKTGKNASTKRVIRTDTKKREIEKKVRPIDYQQP